MANENEQPLITRIVELAPGIAESADALLSPVTKAKGLLSERLRKDNKILTVPEHRPPQSICAIDGARVQEQLYAADLIISVAATANGRIGTATPAPATTSSAWADIVKHDSDASQIAAATMACQEVELAVKAEHEIRIIDGSFITPILGVAKGMFTRSPGTALRVATLSTETWDMPTNFRQLFTHNPARPILAVPKSDQSSEYVKAAVRDYKIPISSGDRFLATQVLRPGEMFTPRPVREHSNQKVETPASAAEQVREIADRLDAAIEPLRIAATNQGIWTTYVRPMGSSTVLRVEYFVAPGEDPVLKGQEYAALLSAEIRPPHMLEPFCQWAVDRQVKTVSQGAKALRARMFQLLPEERRAEYATYLAQGYRT